MVKDIIDNVSDLSLKVTMQLLYILIHEPGKYNLDGLAEKTGYGRNMIYMALSLCLSQNVFEFYSGDTKLNEENINIIKEPHIDENLSVVTKVDFTDEEGYRNFESMLEDYRESISKRKSFEKIAVYNSFRVTDGIDNPDTDASAMKILSENRTVEYVYLLDNSRFFPLSIYNSRSYNQEYLVALKKADQGYIVKFYPLMYSKMCTDHTVKYLDVSEVYPDDAIINARKALKSMWGPHDMSLDEKPFTVSAVIYDINCLGKIQHDISGHDGRLTSNDDGTYSLYLEVLGSEAFKTWVLSYGSSIEIIEPKKLRKNLTEIYKAVAKQYI